MSESLHETKRRLEEQFLDRHGIHGIGLREKAESLCVYYAADSSAEQESTLREIERFAAPHRVAFIPSEPPSAR